MAAAHAAEADRSDPSPKHRDWVTLVLTHVKVAALCPTVAATAFWLAGPERSSLLHLKGILAFIVMVGCTYLFFGLFAVAAVGLISPGLWVLSKIPWPLLGRAAALIVGGGAAWLICEFTINDMPPFRIALAVTAAFATVLLEAAWRRSVRGSDNHLD